MNRNKLLLLLISITIFLLSNVIYAQDSNDSPTIGLLIYDTPSFISEMESLGYVEGENINYMMLDYNVFTTMELADALKAIDEQTQAMIDKNVDIFIVNNDTEALNLRQRVGDIPIVFDISDDPVATGAVADLTVPGGFTTGVVSNQHHPRRLQLLTEIDPSTKKVYYLYASFAIEGEMILEQVKTLGEALGVEVIPAPVADLETGLEALKNAPEDVDWFFQTPYLPFDLEFIDALTAASIERQAPIAGYFPYSVGISGNLIDFGPDLVFAVRLTAQISDRILRGADPGELPVIITDNALVVDLGIADSLGMEIPIAILRQADLIIRPGDSENAGG